MPVEEVDDFLEPFFRFGCRDIAVPGAMWHGFVNIERGLDPCAAQLSMDSDCAAQQQIARPGNQERRRKTMHVSEYWGEKRVGQIVAVSVESGSGITACFRGDKNVVDHRVDLKAVASVGQIRHRRPGCYGSG